MKTQIEKQQMKTGKKIISGIGIVLMTYSISMCDSGNAKNNHRIAQALLGETSLEQAPPISPSSPILSSIASYAAFGGGAGITNSGTQTQIIGNMGTTGASTMITGFHNLNCGYTETPLNIGSVSGTNYTNVPPAFGANCTEGTTETFVVATSAAADALTAYNDLAARPDGTDPGAGQLGGLTLYPGVYKSAAGPFLITGSDLTLDAQGNANAVWIFQMASSLVVGTPTASQSIILTNGAQAKNVYWQVGSAATINGAGGGTMVGTIIASAGMTFSTAGNQTVTTLNGRAIALFAAITMVNTVINTSDVPVVIIPPVVIVPVTPAAPVTVTGTTASAVVAVAGAGFINVENNGGLVTVTETGTGTINIVNNGAVLTATNTGNGTMTINSTCTGVVTVTNTGNGRITVNATGSDTITIVHTGDEDVSYP